VSTTVFDGRGTYIEHLGHTSFAVYRGGCSLLIDPILARQDLDFRRPTWPRWYTADAGAFQAVLISHGHNDHLHPPSLLGLPESLPIHFMAEDPATCSCPPDEDPYRLLPNLGFEELRPFRPGDRLDFDDGVTVHALPAQASSEGEEQCCFLVETPDVVMLDAVDIKDAPETRAALEPWRGHVDLAFVPTGAALQFQGFWNQMDTIAAVAFCEWLQPAQVATCGGAVSLSERVRPDTLERYPHDLADWLAAAGDRLPGERLQRQRPPCLFVYRDHELTRATPLQPAGRPPTTNGRVRPQALIAAFFSGYHPRTPTRRNLWPDSPLAEWLGAFGGLRELIRAAEGDLRHLLRRCRLEINRTPAALLAPTTLRRLLDAEAFAAAARISAHVPEPPADPADLETGYFAVVSALLASDEALDAGLRAELETCLWIDHRMFQLSMLHLRLRPHASYTAEEAARLRAEHVDELAATLDRRRPLLGPHPFRLDRDQARLLTGEALEPEAVGLLCYASPAGVFRHPLNQLEDVVLDLCDGRSFPEIVAEVGAALAMPEDEVRPAVFNLLTSFSRRSILLLDWSR
jgi:L-ascorbate metabolism protein UlaG (beta-lactamase superfamily)